MAAVCVTTGPGGTNTITGVLGGWLDSVPMFIISGQVRYETTTRYMNQYAVLIEDPLQIRYALEKAYYLATTGRRVWDMVCLRQLVRVKRRPDVSGF